MGVRGLTAFLDRSPTLWDTLTLKPQVTPPALVALLEPQSLRNRGGAAGLGLDGPTARCTRPRSSGLEWFQQGQPLVLLARFAVFCVRRAPAVQTEIPGRCICAPKGLESRMACGLTCGTPPADPC